jgi:cytochrome c oxidase assembly protein subunit 15
MSEPSDTRGHAKSSHSVGFLTAGILGTFAALGDTLTVSTSLAEGLRSDFSALSNIFVRLRILHPIVAGALGVWLLALAFQVIASRPSDVIAKRLGRTVGVLVLSQCALGMANIVLLTPPWLQLLHLLGADLLWIACVLLASELLSGPRRTTSPARAEVYAAAYR